MISDSSHNKELNTAPEEKYEKVHFNRIDSTNEEAKRIFREKPEDAPILLWADEQTAGKGRNNREFYSPKNTGLYFSYMYPVKKPKEIKDRIFVTTAAAVFTAKALRQYAGADAKIKWVNDIYLNEKKVCGILAEALFDEAYTAIIVGIGINLTTAEFPDEIKETASGIGEFDEEKLKELKEQIITSVGNRLTGFFENCEDAAYRKDIIEEYRALSMVIGREVIFYKHDEEKKTGIATGIEEDGSLIVTLSDGSKERLASGEIHLCLTK